MSKRRNELEYLRWPQFKIRSGGLYHINYEEYEINSPSGTKKKLELRYGRAIKAYDYTVDIFYVSVLRFNSDDELYICDRPYIINSSEYQTPPPASINVLNEDVFMFNSIIDRDENKRNIARYIDHNY